MSINVRIKTVDGKLIKVNALENGGFEAGALTGWTTQAMMAANHPYQGSWNIERANDNQAAFAYQDCSFPSDLVSEVYCYAIYSLAAYQYIKVYYSDASSDTVAFIDSNEWHKESLVPDAGKVITRVEVGCTYAGAGTKAIRMDNITVTCQNRISFAAADGKLTQDSDFPTTITKNVFINVSDKLYQANQEAY